MDNLGMQPQILKIVTLPVPLYFKPMLRFEIEKFKVCNVWQGFLLK